MRSAATIAPCAPLRDDRRVTLSEEAQCASWSPFRSRWAAARSNSAQMLCHRRSHLRRDPIVLSAFHPRRIVKSKSFHGDCHVARREQNARREDFARTGEIALDDACPAVSVSRSASSHPVPRPSVDAHEDVPLALARPKRAAALAHSSMIHQHINQPFVLIQKPPI